MNVVEITIEGPGKNSLGTKRMESLLHQIEAAGRAPILLTGAGDAFSAGLDLKEVYAADLPQMKGFLRLLTALVVRLYTHEGPTVAAVNGHAIAGGCLLAVLCDLRIGTTNPRARIGLNEVALGLRFPPRVLALTRSRFSPEHEAEILLGAGLHSPQEALRLGMLDRLDDDPLQAARAAITTLASHPPDAYADAKLALHRGVNQVSAEDHARFQAEVIPVWAGAELKQRIAQRLKL